MKKIIFEDSNIVVVFKKGTTKGLVVSFGDMANLANGDAISAEIPLSKFNFNILGISAKSRNWYPEISIKNALESIHKILENFTDITCYGGSMGGYAAIKYSGVLRANSVVAFVPQFSINPESVKDRRYTHYFNKNIHKNMDINENDVSDNCKYTILYDPYFNHDTEQVERIEPFLKRLNLLKSKFFDHHVTSILASSDLLNDLICGDVESSSLYKKMRSIKRQKQTYINLFLDKALVNKGSLILNKIHESKSKIPLNQAYGKKIVQLAIRQKRYSHELIEKIGFNFNAIQSNFLLNTHDEIVVFNLLTSSLESYNESILNINSDFLLPVSIDLGILKVNYRNKEMHIYCNDSGSTKLVEKNSPFSEDLKPVLLNKKNNFLYISPGGELVASARPNGEINIKKHLLVSGKCSMRLFDI